MTSLLLWLMLTWSFGCTGCRRPPAGRRGWRSPRWRSCWCWCRSRSGRRRPGNAASWRSVGDLERRGSAIAIAHLVGVEQTEFEVDASAAAHLTSPSARMNPRGILSPLIGKFSIARCVCAPQSAVAGTRNSPMLSRSTLNSFVDIARRSCSRSPGPGVADGCTRAAVLRTPL